MLYGVQYRNMHTAGHHISIFTKKSAALKMLKFITNAEKLPPCEEQGDVDNIEINFRNVPTTYKEKTLRIVNTDKIVPDIYA